MLKNRYNIMIVPPSTGGVRQYSLPRWAGKAVAFAGTIVVSLVAVSAVLGVSGLLRTGDYAEQVLENRALRASLSKMDEEVAVLRKRLASLEESEMMVRKVFGLSDLDPDERALGIGGPVVESADDDGLSPLLTNSRELEAEIDRLLRRCDFERDNFGQIVTELSGRKDQLDHTPSVYPTSGYFSRGFGIKPDPFTGNDRMHYGIDLAGDIGTLVYAPAAGRVKIRAHHQQFGNMITLDHGFGVETRYGHLKGFAIKPNEQVQRGQLIGYMGNSGYSTGPHLHYEVHVDGRPVDPMRYIYDRAPQSAPLAAGD
ncbi:MAG TPA: peptidoglycan DD-metalloendopeptidase family protein [candidate division Zixibacteria bacterium]|jgi:hypothetical protein